MKNLMIGAALVSCVACTTKKSAPPPAPVAVAPRPAPAPVPAAVVAKPPPDPLRAEVVLDQIHQLDLQLIDASKLASKSAHNAKVKSLAKEVLAARTKSDADLLALGTKLSVTLGDPLQLDLAPTDKATLTATRDAFVALPAKSGPALDAAYLAILDDSLKGELAMLANVSARSTNADLKALATQLTPAVTARAKLTEKELSATATKPHGKRAG